MARYTPVLASALLLLASLMLCGAFKATLPKTEYSYVALASMDSPGGNLPDSAAFQGCRPQWSSMAVTDCAYACEVSEFNCMGFVIVYNKSDAEGAYCCWQKLEVNLPLVAFKKPLTGAVYVKESTCKGTSRQGFDKH